MRINKLLLAALASGMALSACVPADPYSTDPNQRAKSGALMGAITGAALGAATGDSNDKTSDRVIGGALIGGMLGAGIGNALDKQAAELKSQINDSRVRIVNAGDRLIVTMPEGILFAVDSAAVQSGIMNDLYTVADSLNRYPNTTVQVIGHTDNTGAASYNQDLSQRRAESVAAVLRQGGVYGGRLVAFGRGEDQPIASNSTPAGRAQNRRVEIVIIPNR
ncbi:MAG: OmpA family protein [Paracoccaceae bacterium]|jgi:outer membrane protein OmpA-like peptidoglycan-associated protein